MMIQDFLSDIQAVIDACTLLSFTDPDECDKLGLLCCWLGTRIFRQYVKEVWTETYKSKWTWKGKKAYIRNLQRDYTDDDIKKKFVVGRDGKGVPLHASC
jgi:hypothetical protein